MKVHELIELLSDVNPYKTVVVETGCGCCQDWSPIRGAGLMSEHSYAFSEDSTDLLLTARNPEREFGGGET